jgi:hypothetical protein
LQAFPNFRLFSPNISKESFGGFVGYQRVAIDPNKKVGLQTFSALITHASGTISGATR